MKQDSVSGSNAGNGRVTVRDIAAETGLSIATVSRVLNGGGNVAAGTRERVPWHEPAPPGTRHDHHRGIRCHAYRDCRNRAGPDPV